MFKLETYLAQKHAIVEAAIAAALPSVETPPARLHEAMRYSVLGGGKRLRPILCLAACEAVGAAHDPALPPAVALELLHAYTLIHDDLPCMDDDELRRGKPTCHVAFGEANAVLAGDALQTLAFEILADTPVPSPYSTGQLVRELALAAGSRGVVGGQVEDLAAAGEPIDRDRIQRIHTLKTAALFRVAMRLGAMAGGADEAELTALTKYGACTGLAFQIADDLLDAPATGARRTPAAEQEATCLAVYGDDEARARGEDLVKRANAALNALRRGPLAPLQHIADYAMSRTH